MKKIFLRLLLLAIVLFTLYGAFNVYRNYMRDKEYQEYLETVVDTSSPTVSVLRDSIHIGYQDEKRTLHIYVPPNYSTDTLTRYPVMYFLDGESSFNDMENMAPEWQIDEVINKASENGQPTAIVVGIEQAEDRDAEYTPWINDDNPHAHGEKFTRWVATELKPLIDANYRTKKGPKHTTIGGISRSGMMAYYMLMEKPDIFGNAVIQSPSMWVDYDRLMSMNLAPDQLADKKVFVSVGGDEGGNMVPFAKDVYHKFDKMGIDENNLRLEIIPNEGHWHMTWRKSFALAYPWIMK